MLDRLTLSLVLWIMPMKTNGGAVYVVTYVSVHPSSTDRGMALISQYRDAVRREPGVVTFDAVQEIGRPNRFVIVQAWKDQASFDRHEQSPDAADFRARLRTIHNSPSDQRVHHLFTMA